MQERVIDDGDIGSYSILSGDAKRNADAHKRRSHFERIQYCLQNAYLYQDRVLHQMPPEMVSVVMRAIQIIGPDTPEMINGSEYFELELYEVPQIGGLHAPEVFDVDLWVSNRDRPQIVLYPGRPLFGIDEKERLERRDRRKKAIEDAFISLGSSVPPLPRYYSCFAETHAAAHRAYIAQRAENTNETTLHLHSGRTDRVGPQSEGDVLPKVMSMFSAHLDRIVGPNGTKQQEASLQTLLDNQAMQQEIVSLKEENAALKARKAKRGS